MNAPTLLTSQHARSAQRDAGTHLILGCGYTGTRLAELLAEGGAPVFGTARDEERRSEIEKSGARFLRFGTGIDDFDALLGTLRQAAAFSHLASVTWSIPARDDPKTIATQLRALALTVGPDVPVTVIVSTAIFGDNPSVITERTSPQPKNERGARWVALDRAALLLRADGYDFAVVRAPAIYGPGRDYRAKLLTGEAPPVLRPGKPTSRIHVDDLARLLRRMSIKGRPPILLACDEAPSPTWRVMLEASRILGTRGPRYVSDAEAKTLFSPLGYEMRTGGHSCRSIVRPWLGVRLRYPTFREGLRACLGA